jgi:uncharacterized membrane protein (UPF0182 family)
MFPKEKRILGPQQVETKIDQDAELSSQLSLWDQRGSNVIRGNVLAIPVGETLMYVEPIYLQSETAAYPELRLVCVMHEDDLSYAQTFDKALEGIFKGQPVKQLTEAVEKKEEGKEAATAPAGPAPESRELIQNADQYLKDYLRNMGEQRFDDASQALKNLQQTLEELKRQAEEDTLK